MYVSVDYVCVYIWNARWNALMERDFHKHLSTNYRVIFAVWSIQNRATDVCVCVGGLYNKEPSV